MSVVVKEYSKKFIDSWFSLIFLESILFLTFLVSLILYIIGFPINSYWVGGNSISTDALTKVYIGYFIIFLSYIGNSILVYGLIISLRDSEEFVIPIIVGLALLSITNFLIGLFHSVIFYILFLFFVIIKNKDINSKRMDDFSFRRISTLFIAFMLFVFSTIILTISFPTENGPVRTFLYFDMFILFFSLFGLIIFQEKYFIISSIFFTISSVLYIAIYFMTDNYIMMISSVIYSLIFLSISLSRN